MDSEEALRHSPWVLLRNWNRISLNGTLAKMTAFEDPRKKIDALKEHATRFQELVLQSLPSTPLTEVAEPDSVPKRGRPMTQRRLISDGFADVVRAAEAVYSIVGDILVAAVQQTLDGMRGHAFTLLADNRNFTDKLLVTYQRYALSLYYEKDGNLFHVGIRATPAPGTDKDTPRTPFTAAGVFNLNRYDFETGQSSGTLTNLSLFPELIVAYDLDHAKLIRAQRKKQESGQ